MVTWAQRPNLVFLTICLEDCDKPEIKVEADQLHFKGVGGPDKKPHEVTIKFFKEIDTEVRFLTSYGAIDSPLAVTILIQYYCFYRNQSLLFVPV